MLCLFEIEVPHHKYQNDSLGEEFLIGAHYDLYF